MQTSLGKVLLATLDITQLDRVLATPSRSGIEPHRRPERDELDEVLRDVRARIGDPIVTLKPQLSTGDRAVGTHRLADEIISPVRSATGEAS
ncbi:hypothetical protein ACWGQ5_20615 [Streptomyces sp. NPDC055722]